jgi:hypothetical protein
MRGLCPRAPGIYRFWAGMAQSTWRATRRRARHSSPWAGARVASLRCPVFRPGTDQYMSGHFPIVEKSIARRPANGV